MYKKEVNTKSNKIMISKKTKRVLKAYEI